MINFEARKFGDEHQAQSLAGWCGGVASKDRKDITFAIGTVAPGSHTWAAIGDWIIRAEDGTVRAERAGNQDGYCTDCGEPVWWQDNQLVVRSGRRWCFGMGEAHPGMTRHHALPGMAQYVVPSPEGQVCHCLARSAPHIHQIIMVSS